MSDIPTSEVLYRAADLIEERGWATGNCGMKASGPACLEGAIAEAGGVEAYPNTSTPILATDAQVGDLVYSYWETDHTPAYRAVEAYLAHHGFRRCYDYNDQPGRTATEVIATLRAAAVIEAAKENTEAREQVTS